MQALPLLNREEPVLILYGDVPLLRADTLRKLADAAGGDKLAILTVQLDDPTGYGRIVRDGAGHIVRIVEQKDASEAERAIREVNTGIMPSDQAESLLVSDTSRPRGGMRRSGPM